MIWVFLLLSRSFIFFFLSSFSLTVAFLLALSFGSGPHRVVSEFVFQVGYLPGLVIDPVLLFVVWIGVLLRPGVGSGGLCVCC